MCSIEFSKEETEGIAAKRIHHIREQEPAAEAKHLPGRTKVDMQRGTPWRVIPVHQHHTGDKEQTLSGEPPEGISKPSHQDAHHIGDHQADDGYDARLLVHHIAEKPSTLHGSETCDEETQKHVSAQPEQVGIMIEISYEGSAQVEQEIE